METKKKWYKKTGWIIALLILFFPVGLVLMWKFTTWSKPTKWIITAILLILFASNLNSSKNAPTTTAQPNNEVGTQQPTQAQAATTELPVKTTSAPTQAQTKQSAPASNETVSQKNAVKKAKSYLAYTAFSHDGLVAQLEYEQFSHDDAVYGADNSGGNWNEQAAKKAKSYMDMSAFSRGSLIEQLKFEKFTQEQAEYGANAVGL